MSDVSDASYEKVLPRDLRSERYDHPDVAATVARRKYVICSTPRSGSTLLCRQLINAGLGVPDEYFNPRHMRPMIARWQLDPHDGVAYRSLLFARRTTPNGVWGVKLQWDQLDRFWHIIVPEVLSDARFIFLYRTDVIAQAVSLHLSRATGVWGFEGIGANHETYLPLDDLEDVKRCGGRILFENKQWQAFFTERRLKPLVIRYEDLTADQPGHVRKIGDLLGLEATAYRVPPPEPHERRDAPEIAALREDLIRRCREMLKKV